jgi:hypothetical protein
MSSTAPYVEEPAAGAGRLAVQAVVGAHHALGAAFDDGGAEGGQVGLTHVALGGGGVEAVALGLGAAVDGVVLGRRGDLEVFRIVAL